MFISGVRRWCRQWWRAGVALGLAAASTSAGAEVYRCTRDGAVVYSDKPCDGASQPAKLPNALIVPAGPPPNLVKLVEEREAQVRAAREQAEQIEAEKARAAEQQARQTRQTRQGDIQRMETYASEAAVTATAERIPPPAAETVVEGMSVIDVRRVHGEPAVVSRVDGAFPTRETWSYVLEDGSRVHIAMVGGKVVSVQTRKEQK